MCIYLLLLVLFSCFTHYITFFAEAKSELTEMSGKVKAAQTRLADFWDYIFLFVKSVHLKA